MSSRRPARLGVTDASRADIKQDYIILDAIHGLGMLYADQGKPGEAEKMYQRALEGKEKGLGRDHTSTLDTVNNLGSLYADQGKLGEAEKMYQRALEGYEKALGPELAASYIPALNTVYNLGLLFASQGDIGRARAMYLRALVGYQKVFGDDHPRCQSLRGCLTTLETSAKRVLSVHTKADGMRRPSIDIPRPYVHGTKSASRTNRLLKKFGLR